MDNTFTTNVTDESGTAALGAALVEVLPPGTVVALVGTLGAGKTRLVQAIAAAAGVEDQAVVSPTFVLMQEYVGRRTIIHIDAYRLRTSDEFLELGPEEFFESDALTFIEWADRVADCLPHEHVEIHIEVTGDQSRRFTVMGRGARFADVPARLAVALA
jgi:tRNA threonylcarbamoyladenosine biosynthesis protein TsaE